jgi:hypothetical protein
MSDSTTIVRTKKNRGVPFRKRADPGIGRRYQGNSPEQRTDHPWVGVDDWARAVPVVRQIVAQAKKPQETVEVMP